MGLVEIDSIVPVVADAAVVVGVVSDLGVGIVENDSVQGDQGFFSTIIINVLSS